MFIIDANHNKRQTSVRKEEQAVILQIRKRDGRVAPFHESKLADAINKAFEATYKPGYEDTAARLAH